MRPAPLRVAGKPNAGTELPQTMKVDYVRVFTRRQP
jgi:hypothetical protein